MCQEAAHRGERDPLTERELEILQLIVDGRTNKEIAQALFISEKTVKNHVTNILRKLDLSDRTQEAARVRVRNWIVSGLTWNAVLGIRSS